MALLQMVPNASLIGWFVGQLLTRWPVLIVFGLVSLYVTYFLFQARREIHACSLWINDEKVVSQNSHIVSLLFLFLKEAEQWRAHGAPLPITDYSDRIDSIIEGLTDRLHNAVNLFLIVGLAGTFFGMAEFARQVSPQQSIEPIVVLKALQDALGRSFPIGFLGLCLTIAVHPIVSHYESALREAAKDAVNHALRLRGLHLTQSDFNPLLEAVRTLPDGLAAAIASTHRALIEQFQPLLELPEVVRRASEESLRPLRELYAESRKEWKETVTKLNQQTKRMVDSVDRLEQPIVRLTARIDDIGGLVSSTQEVVNRVLADTERISVAAQQLQLGLEGTAQSLHAASEEFRAIPESVKADCANVHRIVLESIRTYYEDLGRTYVNSVRDVAIAASGEISEAASTASKELTGAAHSLRIVADAITPEIRAAIETGASLLRGHLEEFNKAFSQHFPRAVADLQMSLTDASKQIEVAQAVLNGMVAATKSASEYAQEWKTIDGCLREIGAALQLNGVQLERSATSIKASAEAHSQVPAALNRSVSALEGLMKKYPQSTRARRSLWERLRNRAPGNGA